MQAAALSFMDVDKLAGDTMAVCERMPLSDDDRATLRTAYRTFRDVHLPQQATVRQFVEQSFTAAGPKGEQMLRQMQEPAVQQQLAFYFVTEKSSRDYCMLVFLKVLSGETLALNFDRYAKRIQEDDRGGAGRPALAVPAWSCDTLPGLPGIHAQGGRTALSRR